MSDVSNVPGKGSLRERKGPRATVASLGLLLVAVAVSGPASPQAGAQDSGSSASRLGARLGGFGSGITLSISRPTTVPFDPFVHVQVATALGSVDQSVGQSRAFSAVGYPGEIVASPGGLIGLVGLGVAGQLLPEGHPLLRFYFNELPNLIPPWPLSTEGAFPGDPGRRRDVLADVTALAPGAIPFSAKGLVQETNAGDTSASASVDESEFNVFLPLPKEVTAAAESAAKAIAQLTGGTEQRLDGPSLQLKGMQARYQGQVLMDRALSTGNVEVSEIGILGGLLKLGRVRSQASQEGTLGAVKDLQSGTEVGFANVLGLRAAVTNNGIEIRDQRVPPGSPVDKLVQGALDQAGVKVRNQSATSKDGRVTADGLEIVFNAQEPNLPVPVADTLIGRKVEVRLTLGTAASNMETFPLEDAGAIMNDQGSADLGAEEYFTNPAAANSDGPTSEMFGAPAFLGGEPSVGSESDPGSSAGGLIGSGDAGALSPGGQGLSGGTMAVDAQNLAGGASVSNASNVKDAGAPKGGGLLPRKPGEAVALPGSVTLIGADSGQVRSIYWRSALLALVGAALAIRVGRKRYLSGQLPGIEGAK